MVTKGDILFLILGENTQKYPYPPQGRSYEIQRSRSRRRALTAKIFKGKNEERLEIPGGGGLNQKKTFLGEVWIYFLEPHNASTYAIFLASSTLLMTIKN